jgi:hypothetical protein
VQRGHLEAVLGADVQLLLGRQHVAGVGQRPVVLAGDGGPAVDVARLGVGGVEDGGEEELPPPAQRSDELGRRRVGALAPAGQGEARGGDRKNLT